MPERYVDVFARNPQSPKLVRDEAGWVTTMLHGRPTLRSQPEAYSIEKKLRDMDENGIDISILSPNIPGPCMLAPGLALEGARIINDFIAECMMLHPDRFAGIACLPWQNPDEAIGEMDRALNELRLSAVMLFSNIGGRPVDHVDFEPVFAHAGTLGCPIVIHPTFPVWGEAISDYMMIPMAGFQVDSSFALLRLILSGTLEKFPGLRFLMPHAGGVLPYLIGRIDYQTEIMGRKPEGIVRPPSEYLKQVYMDTCSPSTQALLFAREFVGADHLLLGTDHPWVDPKHIIEHIDSMDLPLQENRRIYSDNALEFFGLEGKKVATGANNPTQS
jgi:predicted TIM-barrel fold metal-dependent hydrolase